MMTAGIIKEDLPVIRREFVIMEVWIFNSKFFKSLSLQKLLFNFCLRSRPGDPTGSPKIIDIKYMALRAIKMEQIIF